MFPIIVIYVTIKHEIFCYLYTNSRNHPPIYSTHLQQILWEKNQDYRLQKMLSKLSTHLEKFPAAYCRSPSSPVQVKKTTINSGIGRRRLESFLRSPSLKTHRSLRATDNGNEVWPPEVIAESYVKHKDRHLPTIWGSFNVFRITLHHWISVFTFVKLPRSDSNLAGNCRVSCSQIETVTRRIVVWGNFALGFERN